MRRVQVGHLQNPPGQSLSQPPRRASNYLLRFPLFQDVSEPARLLLFHCSGCQLISPESPSCQQGFRRCVFPPCILDVAGPEECLGNTLEPQKSNVSLSFLQLTDVWARNPGFQHRMRGVAQECVVLSLLCRHLAACRCPQRHVAPSECAGWAVAAGIWESHVSACKQPRYWTTRRLVLNFRSSYIGKGILDPLSAYTSSICLCRPET